jgi:hypothetical protein
VLQASLAKRNDLLEKFLAMQQQQQQQRPTDGAGRPSGVEILQLFAATHRQPHSTDSTACSATHSGWTSGRLF